MKQITKCENNEPYVNPSHPPNNNNFGAHYQTIKPLPYTSYFKTHIVSIMQKQRQYKPIQQFLPFDPTIIDMFDNPDQLYECEQKDEWVTSRQYVVIPSNRIRFGDEYFYKEQQPIEQHVKQMMEAMGLADVSGCGWTDIGLAMYKMNKTKWSYIKYSKQAMHHRVAQNNKTMRQIHVMSQLESPMPIAVQNPILLQGKLMIKAIYAGSNVHQQSTDSDSKIVVLVQSMLAARQANAYVVYNLNKYGLINKGRNSAQYGHISTETMWYGSMQHAVLGVQLFKIQIQIHYAHLNRQLQLQYGVAYRQEQEQMHGYGYGNAQDKHLDRSRRWLQYGIDIRYRYRDNKNRNRNNKNINSNNQCRTVIKQPTQAVQEYPHQYPSDLSHTHTHTHRYDEQQYRLLILYKILKYYHQQLALSLGNVEYQQLLLLPQPQHQPLQQEQEQEEPTYTSINDRQQSRCKQQNSTTNTDTNTNTKSNNKFKIYVFTDFTMTGPAGKEQCAYDVVTLLGRVLDHGYRGAHQQLIHDIINTAHQSHIIDKFNQLIHTIDKQLAHASLSKSKE